MSEEEVAEISTPSAPGSRSPSPGTPGSVGTPGSAGSKSKSAKSGSGSGSPYCKDPCDESRVRHTPPPYDECYDKRYGSNKYTKYLGGHNICQTPHFHFRTKPLNRNGLTPDEHIALLALPKCWHII